MCPGWCGKTTRHKREYSNVFGTRSKLTGPRGGGRSIETKTQAGGERCRFPRTWKPERKMFIQMGGRGVGLGTADGKKKAEVVGG